MSLTHLNEPDCVASRMGLDLSARRTVTKETKGRYDRGGRRDRTAILDELVALTLIIHDGARLHDHRGLSG